MEQKNKKKKLGWKRAFQNTGYMIGLIMKACPGVFWFGLLEVVLNVVHWLISQTYLYKYTLDALQEGTPLKTVIPTLSFFVAFSVLNYVVSRVLWRYFEKKYPVVDAYFENLLQKKAAVADLACYENP